MVGQDNVVLTRDALADLLRQVLEEAKKPYIDPDVESRKARDRERLRCEREIAEKARRDYQARCTHLREDGSSAVAWATQSDGITRGVCQHCNRLFVPEDPDYAQVIRIPVRSAHPLFV